ncbi:hypothetical protein [Streptomyces antimycoticus]|uniref:hypothetical protein n=1 Tax=Streptomyces antimycoticus TaxID=68175 RepID=UPI00352FF371
MASTVKDTSTRRSRRLPLQASETQSAFRAPSKAGSSAVAGLWKALDRPVAGSPSNMAAGRVVGAPE